MSLHIQTMGKYCLTWVPSKQGRLLRAYKLCDQLFEVVYETVATSLLLTIVVTINTTIRL
jgi:hypothetical protein